MKFDFTGLGKLSKVLTLIPTPELQINFMPIAINEPFLKDIIHVLPFKGKRQINCKFIFLKRQDFYSFKNFFTDCLGNYTKFWLPCWVNEFQLMSDVNNVKLLYIRFCDFSNRYDEHIRIFICTKDTLYIRKVVNYSISENYEILEVDTPLSVKPSDIIIFGRVILARFKEASLQVKFNLITTYKFFAEADVSFIELPYEYAEIET